MTPPAALVAALASIPSPPSTGIEIGPLNLRAYGLMIALGVIAAVWLCGRLLERKGVGTTDDASSAAIWGVAAGIVGARLYHVATDWDRFADDLGAIPKIWEGGLGIPGGLLAGIVVGSWQARRRGIRPSVMMTCAAPAIPLAQAIGRWGNWFNQELFGRPTDLPWALRVDDDVAARAGYPAGTTFHPTFLYESLWNLGLVGVLLWVDRRFRLGPGRLMAVYVMGYGAGRFWVEGLRIDPASDVGGLRWNQWVALAAIVGGAVALVLTRGRTWPDSPAELAVGAVPPDATAPDHAHPDVASGDGIAGDGIAWDADGRDDGRDAAPLAADRPTGESGDGPDDPTGAG